MTVTEQARSRVLQAIELELTERLFADDSLEDEEIEPIREEMQKFRRLVEEANI